MAAPTGAGLTSTPNYHAFGSSSVEAALARAAAEEGSPFLAYRAARMDRQKDTQGYLDNLLKRDAMAGENALRLGTLSQNTEILKNIIPLVKETGMDTQPFLEALMKRGVIGGIGRGAQFNDVNLMNMRAQAAERAGGAVKSAAEGGAGIGGNPLISGLLGGTTPMAPPSVQAAAIHASATGAKEGKDIMKITSPDEGKSELTIEFQRGDRDATGALTPRAQARLANAYVQMGWNPDGTKKGSVPGTSQTGTPRGTTTPGAADLERFGRNAAAQQRGSYIGPGTMADGRPGAIIDIPGKGQVVVSPRAQTQSKP